MNNTNERPTALRRVPPEYPPPASEYPPSEYIESASEYQPSEYPPSEYPQSLYIESASEYPPSEYIETASEYAQSEYIESASEYGPPQSTSHYRVSQYAPIQPASNYRHTIATIPEETEAAHQQLITQNNTPQRPPAQPQQAQTYPIKDAYTQRPPISDKTRQPAKLYNTDCGVKYLGVGAVFKKDLMRFNKLWQSETACIMRLILVIYFWRNNTITGKHQLPLSAVQQIHSSKLTQYKIPTSELYKRYLIHNGHLTQRQADSYNFWNLEPQERRNWARHLERAGKCRDLVGVLWRLGEENGREYLQLVDGPICRSFVQSINSVHDIVAMWGLIFDGDTYIDYDLAKITRFHHC